MVNICVPEFTDAIKSVVRELRDNRKSYFRIWLPKNAYSDANKNVRNWKDIGELEKGVQIDKSLRCFEWNLGEESVIRREDIYRYCVEHSCDGGCWVLLTEEKRTKGQKSFFLDSKEDIGYPDEWIHLLCFDNAEEVLTFCREIEDAYANLSQSTKFKIEHGNFKHTRGAQVYSEIKTGNLWYLDTFHRDHFEVFDKFGKKHLGISDKKILKVMDGTADNTKKPIL